MIFGSLFAALFLTAATFAAPEGAIDRRSSRPTSHQSKPLQRLSESTGLTNSEVVYSSNWAGVVWEGYPSNTFHKVTGTFAVPTPSAPNGDASIWVGIDGDTCGSAILQTGISISYKNGVISYDSWYEWLPDYAYSYSRPIAIRAGDNIRLTVTAWSTTSGTTLIENLTTGKSESKFLSNPSNPLCLQNAEWIVEDFSSNGHLVPFCNFGTVTFSSASAYLRNGKAISPHGATEFGIQQKGKVLTSVSESSSGTVTIKYV